MAIDFKVVRHTVRSGLNVVEILVDGSVAGVIYPADGKEIKIVSAHVEETKMDEGFSGEVVEDDGSGSYPPIPSVMVRFNPSPYVISGGRIFKLPKN